MTTLKLTCKVRFGRSGKSGGKELHVRTDDRSATARVPRVARLMALAIKLEGLISDGTLKDQAAIARLGGVTRARVTQIMNLVLLAPDIQEQLLFLPTVERGRPGLVLRDLQVVVAELDWRKQRRIWTKLAR